MLPDRRLYLGTDDGLRVFDGASETVTATSLAGDPVRDIAIDPSDSGTVWVGSALGGWGLHRTTDGGTTVECVGFEDHWVWGVDRLPDDSLYVGTEPPGLFRREESGEFEPLDGIHEVAGRDDWQFGYEPFEAGHVHGVTAHPGRPNRLFAAVEIGGVLISDDGGATWRSRLHGADVHRVAVAPTDADHVYAATESGVKESHDGGDSWDAVDETDGLYVKFLAFGPDGTLYAPAASDMGDTDVRVFACDDEWERRATVTEASVLAFAAVDGRLLLQRAGDEGRLLVSDDDGRSWEAVGPRFPRARCIVPASV